MSDGYSALLPDNSLMSQGSALLDPIINAGQGAMGHIQDISGAQSALLDKTLQPSGGGDGLRTLGALIPLAIAALSHSNPGYAAGGAAKGLLEMDQMDERKRASQLQEASLRSSLLGEQIKPYLQQMTLAGEAQKEKGTKTLDAGLDEQKKADTAGLEVQVAGDKAAAEVEPHISEAVGKAQGEIGAHVEEARRKSEDEATIKRGVSPMLEILPGSEPSPDQTTEAHKQATAWSKAVPEINKLQRIFSDPKMSETTFTGQNAQKVVSSITKLKAELARANFTRTTEKEFGWMDDVIGVGTSGDMKSMGKAVLNKLKGVDVKQSLENLREGLLQDTEHDIYANGYKFNFNDPVVSAYAPASSLPTSGGGDAQSAARAKLKALGVGGY